MDESTPATPTPDAGDTSDSGAEAVVSPVKESFSIPILDTHASTTPHAAETGEGDSPDSTSDDALDTGEADLDGDVVAAATLDAEPDAAAQGTSEPVASAPAATTPHVRDVGGAVPASGSTPPVRALAVAGIAVVALIVIRRLR